MDSTNLSTQHNGVNGSNCTQAEGIASGRSGDGATQVVIQRNPHLSKELFNPTGPSILQLNVEGLTRAKCEVLQQIGTKYSISIILLQETHTKADDEIKILGYTVT